MLRCRQETVVVRCLKGQRCRDDIRAILIAGKVGKFERYRYCRALGIEWSRPVRYNLLDKRVDRQYANCEERSTGGKPTASNISMNLVAELWR